MIYYYLIDSNEMYDCIEPSVQIISPKIEVIISSSDDETNEDASESV